MFSEQTISIRVRYTEVDAMGYLHHSRFFQYFEIGRVELLRLNGHQYADLEKRGIFFVVARAECKFMAPARYDEIVELTTRVERQTLVRIDHVYELKRKGTLLASAKTTIACVDREGKLKEIPAEVLGKPTDGAGGL